MENWIVPKMVFGSIWKRKTHPRKKQRLKGVYATRRFQKTILERFGKPTSTDNLT
jgi:hypothetical protein